MSEIMENQNQEMLQQLSEQETIRREKLQKLVEAGKDPYTITRYDRTHTSQQILDNYEENQQVSIAGRMMARRIMGKASFAHLQDNDGKIQIYVRRDDVGEEAYAAFKQCDIGDIFGVKGFEFQTKTGEISVPSARTTKLSRRAAPLF